MIVSDIEYPDGFPCPQWEGYNVNHVQTFERTEMRSGRARQYRLYSSVPSIVNVAWVFENDSLAAAFEAWFREALHDGVEWFNCPLKSPVGYQDYVCRFAEMYKGPVPIAPNTWRIVATLEMRERPLLGEDWGLFPEFVVNASLFDIAMNRKWPEA